jgi:radical SAM superfamily enzyme YgiQ (UPF0313 family)
MFFASLLTREERATLITSVSTKIDHYIKENNLHTSSCAGFTMKSQQWLMSAYIISRLKEMNPDITIVIGGIVNESQARAFMKGFHLADYAIWGEGEYPLYYLAEALEDHHFETVPNMVYRDNGSLCSTHQSSEYPDLNSYPFADHTDYFDTLYRVIPGSLRVQIPVWGSRSCPWNKCKFCVDNEEYPYRTRSPENIVEEIMYQSKKYTVDTFTFVDSELPGNKKRFKRLLQLLTQLSAARNEPYHFFGEVSPVFIDDETAQYMRLASFISIQLGFEALTDILLEKMRKRQKFAHNIQALKLGNQYNLRMGGLNILQEIPTETAEDIQESCQNVKFVRFLLNTFTLNPRPFVLYKGSAFYDEIPEPERESWNYDDFWIEIAPTGVVPESERFEFFGFIKERSHSMAWDDFEMVLKVYTQQNCSYTWIEYPGGSFIEEKGFKTYRYVLDRDETDILIYCNSVKTLSEVKSKFSHISEENLVTILHTLKEAGLLYYEEGSHTLIAVVEASQMEPAEVL